MTHYLSRDAIVGTVKAIAKLAATGSTLIMEFIRPPSSLPPEEGALVSGLAASSAGVGEPWLSLFEPAEMEALLRTAGYDDVVHYGPDDLTERYLRGRTDGMRMPGYFNMMKATVRR